MKTLQEIKDGIAKSFGMKWEQVILDRSLFDSVVHIVAKRYAEQVIEKIQSKVNKIDEGRTGCTYNDTDFDSQSVCYGYNSCVEDVQKDILNLKNELK